MLENNPQELFWCEQSLLMYLDAIHWNFDTILEDVAWKVKGQTKLYLKILLRKPARR